MGLLAKISKLIIDLDRDPTAHHLVSLILDELLDVLVPVDPTAVVWSHHDHVHLYLIGLVPLVGLVMQLKHIPLVGLVEHVVHLLGVDWLHLPISIT